MFFFGIRKNRFFAPKKVVVGHYNFLELKKRVVKALDKIMFIFKKKRWLYEGSDN